MSDQRIPISQLSETQTAPDASYIAIDDGSLTKKITVENFNSTSTASAQQYANQAAASAQTVEDNIATSAAQIREATLAAREATQASTAASASATSAYDSASLAQNYSVNAATSAGQAMSAADTASQAITESRSHAQDSEAWAVGKRNGSDVPASDETYQNNAKYYADSASGSATRAEAAAQSITVPDTTLTVSGVAADSKATGDRITEVKNDLNQSNNGQKSIGTLSEFTQGATYNGEIQSYGKYRVANVDLITFSTATKVTIANGFWISIIFFVNGTYQNATSWAANLYNIPAGSTVRFSIRRQTEDTSETADIFEFTRAVTINTGIQDQINNMNTNLSGQITTLINNVNHNVNQAVKSYGQVSASNIGTLGWTSVTDFNANRVYGIGSDITSGMVTDLPYYGGYGQLKITAGIFPNIYKKYEYTSALNDTWIAWQTNNNTSLSAWKKLASAESVSFKTVADRTQITPSSKVIFIGDSIVAGVGGTGWQQTSGRKLLTYNGVDLYANDEGTCWANMMRDYLVTNYGCTAYNNGLSGFNSVNIPQNISTLVPSDATHVFACWGINDRAYNYDTVSGYQTVIDYCNSIGAKIVPITICPCLQPNDIYSHTQYEILTRIKTVCENNNFEVCDLFSEVHEYFYIKGITLDTNYIPDNLHPNDAMYTIMYHLMRKLLGV